MAEAGPSTSSFPDFQVAENLTVNSSVDNVTKFDNMNVSSFSLHGSKSSNSIVDHNSGNKGDSSFKSERYKYTESCQKKLDEVLDYFKDFYTFLLLDKSKVEDAIKNIDDFPKAVFYVGVGQLSSGMNMPKQTEEFKAKIKETTWEKLKVSGNISKEEAFKCQAFLIETIDVKYLNKYYPKDSTWKQEIKMIPEEIKEVGLALLEEVRIEYERAGPKSFENQYISLENIDEDDHFKKLYYTYLLLDPRKLTKPIETIDDFADAIFYVGKGSSHRVFNHRSETRKIVEYPTLWTKKITAKHQKIIEIWRDVGRILRLKVSQYISLGEAATREAFLIETISLDNLANNRMGTYKYYPKASKDQKNRMVKNARCEVGTALLQEAMTIFAEKRRRCAPMSMHYSRKRKFVSLQSVKLVYDESCKAKFKEFSNILDKELNRFSHYPKNTAEEFFFFIRIMLDRLKPTATCVANFVDALIYVSLEKEDQSLICKQRYRKTREMYKRKGVASDDKQMNRLYKLWEKDTTHVHYWQCPIKFRFARGLYFEGLLAYILGKEKTNNLVINVHEMMTSKDLGKASIELLEQIRILYVKTDTQPTLPETPVRPTPHPLLPAHLFELPAPLATPPIEPLPTYLPISP